MVGHPRVVHVEMHCRQHTFGLISLCGSETCLSRVRQDLDYRMQQLQNEEQPNDELLEQCLRQGSLILEALTKTNQELLAERARARLAESMQQLSRLGIGAVR